MKLTLTAPTQFEGTFSRVRLRVEQSSYVRLYTGGLKQSPVTLTGGSVEWTVQDFAGASTKDIWAEFGQGSSGVGDYSFTYEGRVNAPGDAAWVRLDRVSVTAMWATATVLLSHSDSIPSILTGTASASNIMNHKARDDTLFGYGEWDWVNNVVAGGRVQLIWSVLPAGVQNLGVCVDTTRQVGDAIYYTTTLAPEDWKTRDYVSLASLPDEQPNDDLNANTEYLGRGGSSGQLYACDWDAPWLIRSGQDYPYWSAYYLVSRRFVGKSWLRAQLGSSDGFPNNSPRIGSRVSAKLVWHCSYERIKSGSSLQDREGTTQKCELGYISLAR